MGSGRHDKNKNINASHNQVSGGCVLLNTSLKVQVTLTPETTLQAPRSNVKVFRKELKFSRDTLLTKSSQKMLRISDFKKMSSV